MRTPSSRLLNLGRLTEQLQTKQGRQLWKGLVRDLEPHTKHIGMLEPGCFAPDVLEKLPPLQQALLTAASETFTPAGSLERDLPEVLANALSEFADSEGGLDPELVQKGLGPEGLRFLQQLNQAQGAKPQLADRFSFGHLGPHESKAFLQSSTLRPPPMAALDWAVDEIAEPGELEGLGFYGLQHLFLSSASLFEGLERVGIDPSDMKLQGKVYSTNRATMAWMESKGAQVAPTSFSIGPAQDFEKVMKASIRDDLERMVQTLPRPPEENPNPRFLLIDDGGKAIELLHTDFPEYAPYFTCVEQTRRGARAVQALPELKCPVINVAESWAKLHAESPMIGHSVVLEVGRKLSELQRSGVDLGSSAGVLGYGSVGGAVADSLLQRGFTVHVYDPDPEKRARALADAKRDGFEGRVIAHERLEDALPHAKTLVSCVGRRTLEPEHHRLLPDGAVLVNAASSDDELGPEDLRPFRIGGARDGEGRIWTLFQGQAVCLGHGEAEAHSSIIARLPNGKELFLANDGYVVNMTGERDPIPPRYIQLTRTLLFLGAIAARRAKEPGLHEVPKNWQEELVAKVEADLARTGESLHAPNWEEHEPSTLAPPALPSEAVQEALGLTTASFPEGTVYGYRLGPVEPGSIEASAHRLHGDKSGELALHEAVIHKLSADTERHFKGGSFKITVDADQARVPHSEGVGKAGFEQLYAAYLASVLQTWGRGRGHKLTAPEVVKQAHRLLLSSDIDDAGVIDALRTHAAPEVRALGQAVYRRRR